jgi:hypothetical protein
MSAQNVYPWLAKHRIASPCKVKWIDMSGDEKKRFCGQCKLNVYNLSAMSSSEAESLLAKNNGRICTYFYQRTDGTVLTKDCPVGLRQVYRQRGLIAAALYAASLLVAMPFGRTDEPLMGDIAVPEAQLMGGAPPVEKLGEPAITPAATPTPTPTPTETPEAQENLNARTKPCPRPLLGKPAVRR